MTGAFGPTINLAAEFLPAGRTRANRRGCIAASCDPENSKRNLAENFECFVEFHSYQTAQRNRKTSTEIRGIRHRKFELSSSQLI
jgi:hypothetical protein